MKIGIITFWNSQDNYGQIAQLFALQEYLRKMDHDPFLIRYIDDVDKPMMYEEKSLFNRLLKILINPTKIWAYINNLKNKQIAIKNNILNNRKFDDFRNKYIKNSDLIYNSFEELINNPPKADIYICGSDMIWNEFVTKPAYFLKFGDSEIKKIAFAVSFAKSYASADYIEKLKIYVEDFAFIGVREKSGIDICCKAGFDNAEWVPDPTMLLKAEDYGEKFNLMTTSEKYVFIYLLGYKLKLDINDIQDFAKERNLKVRYVASQFKVDNYQKIYPTIEEWFENIKNAEYVITNSFHCCVISLIFNKKFLFIPLLGHTSENNERIYSLFQDFSIDREFKGEINKIDEQIEWSEINKNFQRKHDRVKEIFDSIIC